MKKLFVLLAAAASLLTWSCKTTEDTTPSLSVKPSSLTFDGNGAAPQTITVNATNVEWDYNLSEGADKWVTVTKAGAGLEVSVSDNPYATDRTAAITITPKNATGVKNVNVAIKQLASDTPVNFELNIDPSSLSFEATGGSENVTITCIGEGLTYTVEYGDASYAEWVTYTQTETGLFIEVKPSTVTNVRTATILINPSEEMVGQKAIAISQEAYVEPASLTYTISNGTPNDQPITLPFNYQGMNQKIVFITVNAVNCEWYYEVTEGSDWLIVNKAQIEGEELYNLNLSSETYNTGAEAQNATITISTLEEGIGPFEIKVIRNPKSAGLSSIISDIAMDPFTSNQVCVKNNVPEYSYWKLELFTNDVKMTAMNYGYDGTGQRLHVYFNSTPVEIAEDGSATLPEGEYTITADFNSTDTAAAGMIKPGDPNTFNIGYFPVGSWYVEQSGKGVAIDTALLNAGTMTVTDNGNGTYKIDFDFTCDNGHKVTATYEGALNFRSF